MLDPSPTYRAVLDPNRLCHAHCRHCYFRFEEMKSVRPLASIKTDIDAAVNRGNDACDITGGEAMLHPDIVEIVRYCRQCGLPARIITLGLSGPELTQRVIDAGIDTWLLSMHGLQQAHDEIVGLPNARKAQERFIAQVKAQTGFDVNSVIIQDNQADLAAFAEYLAAIQPRFVNLIHFNAHRAWAERPEARELLPNLDIVETGLNEGIPIMETAGIGVTVRYYPMCRLASEFRRCVCNDLHVLLDGREWDSYCAVDKTQTPALEIIRAYRETGRALSLQNEEQGEPCCRCGLHRICGGMHSAGHRIGKELYGEQLKPEPTPPDADPDDFYFYRRYARTL